ncbi:hypothetical protein ACO0LB_18045 [Undibacterium sp. SXout7W]
MNSNHSTGVHIRKKDFFNLPEHCRRVVDGIVEVLSKETFVKAIITD